MQHPADHERISILTTDEEVSGLPHSGTRGPSATLRQVPREDTLAQFRVEHRTYGSASDATSRIAAAIKAP